jgi:hypothetical protein
VIDLSPADADAVAGIVDASLVRTRYPQARRTFMRFRDATIKGANLFLFRSPAAGGLVAFWQAGEASRKQPWRLIARIGPLPLLQFLLGRLTLNAALAHLSRVTGTRLAVARLPFAEAALDVDDEEDRALAEAARPD